MKILVVCGAGASSTFVAHRLRRSAAVRGIDIVAEACPVDLLASRLADCDVVLLGAHLGDRIAELRTVAGDAGPAIALLPETVFSLPNGDEALDLALNAAGARS